MLTSGLRARLLVVVLLLLAPVWILTFSRFAQERRLLVASVDREAERLAHAASSAHDAVVNGIHQVMAGLSQTPELKANPPRCTPLFETVVETSNFFAELAAFDATSGLLCSARSPGNALALADRAIIQEALAARTFVTGRYHAPVAGDAGTVGFANPIVAADGQAIGALFAAVHVGTFGTAANEVQVPESGALLLIDQQGVVLTRLPQALAWTGRQPRTELIRTILDRHEGLVEAAGVDGQRRLYSFLPLRSTNSRVFLAVGISKEEALAELDRRNELHTMGLAFISVLGLVAAWVMGGRSLVGHLNALVAAARRLQGGDLAARVAVRGHGEVASLADAFNDMAAQINETITTEREARATLLQQINTVIAERTREVSLLNQMGELLQACFSLDQAYGVLGGIVHQFFPGRAGAVFVFNETRELLEEGAFWGKSAGQATSFAPDDCWALRAGRPHVVDEGGTPWCPHVLSPLPTGSICIPLLAQGEAFGIFYLCNPAGASLEGFPEETRRVAAAVAKQIALALANLRLRDTLRGQSIRDPLTGLYNRRYMEETVERELRRAARSGRPVGVIMLDIDSFKLLNDTFGHAGGDAVLRAVGSLIKTTVRGSDIACRYGGDEIVLILPETGLEPTATKAEQLREAVKRLQVSHRGQTLERVSVSLGVAAFPDHGPEAASLLSAADEALYAAKAGGKDQVRLAAKQVRFDNV